ncbi:hypothetical protein MMA231_03766 (plasmid) [Asticcacaulis sp. MM231]
MVVMCVPFERQPDHLPPEFISETQSDTRLKVNLLHGGGSQTNRLPIGLARHYGKSPKAEAMVPSMVASRSESLHKSMLLFRHRSNGGNFLRLIVWI